MSKYTHYLKLEYVQARVLSEALSQYIDNTANADDPEEQSQDERNQLRRARLLLDEVDAFIVQVLS